LAAENPWIFEKCGSTFQWQRAADLEEQEMKWLKELFAGSSEPERPDDYYLYSAIASVLSAFVASEGIGELIKGDWSVELSYEYGVALTRLPMATGSRARVRLRSLSEFANYRRTMKEPLIAEALGYMATDHLAWAVLAKMKDSIGLSQ